MNRRHSILLLGAVLTLAPLGACGSEPSEASADDGAVSADASAAASPVETAAPSTGTGPGAGALAYAQCMRDEGVSDFPDPQIDGGRVQMSPQIDDPNDPTFQAAQERCEPLLARDSGGTVEVDEERQAEVQEAVLAFAQCMREHGIDMPDPQVDGGRVIMRAGPGEGGAGPAPDSAEFQAAQEACQALMPEPPGGSAG